MSKLVAVIGVLGLLVVAAACRDGGAPLVRPLVPPGQPAMQGQAGIPAARAVPIERADAWDDVWQTVERRPLRMTDVKTTNECPTSPIEPLYADSKGIGDSPVYPLASLRDPRLILYNPAPDPDGRHSAKVLWIGDPVYRGPALIRGKQVDGADLVRFRVAASGPAGEELRFAMWTGVSSPDFPPEWRQRPSLISFAAPGCYAFQIDGVSFSRVVVVRATAA